MRNLFAIARAYTISSIRKASAETGLEAFSHYTFVAGP